MLGPDGFEGSQHLGELGSLLVCPAFIDHLGNIVLGFENLAVDQLGVTFKTSHHLFEVRFVGLPMKGREAQRALEKDGLLELMERDPADGFRHGQIPLGNRLDLPADFRQLPDGRSTDQRGEEYAQADDAKQFLGHRQPAAEGHERELACPLESGTLSRDRGGL